MRGSFSAILLLFASAGACAGTVDDAIASYEKVGIMQAYFAISTAGDKNAQVRNCLDALEQLELTHSMAYIQIPKGSKMLMLASLHPEVGHFIYVGDHTGFMRSEDIRKFERCKIKGYYGDRDGYAFDMKLGDGEVMHMMTDGYKFQQQASAPGKDKVPFTCTARVKDLTATAEAKDRLAIFVATAIHDAGSARSYYLTKLMSAEKEYREASAHGNPIGKKVDDWWLDSHYGAPIMTAARRSNEAIYKAAIDECKKIDSETVREAVTEEYAKLEKAPAAHATELGQDKGSSH